MTTSPEATVTPQHFTALRQEIAKVVIGQDQAVTGLVISVLCGGHTLLEGVPGTAKTLLVKALGVALDSSTNRVQFTPDLMPADITGSAIFDARTAQFSFRPGPVFANLVLADEINRTPPKTQAALLEAMAERQVTVDGTAHPLPEVFCVAATQNPIEQEGTYPLPEAQLDRFLLKITMDLPARDAERGMLNAHMSGFNPQDLATSGLRKIVTLDQVLAARLAIKQVSIDPKVGDYIVDLCRATRAIPSVLMGVSPRGIIALAQTARTWAWLNNRDYVSPDDVKALALPTLAHRIRLRPEAELEEMTTSQVITGVLATTDVPR